MTHLLLTKSNFRYSIICHPEFLWKQERRIPLKFKGDSSPTFGGLRMTYNRWLLRIPRHLKCCFTPDLLITSLVVQEYATMKISVILGHPDKNSFNFAIADTAVKTLRDVGHGLMFHDLYREDFPPVIPAGEIPKDRQSRNLSCRLVAQAQRIEI